MSNPAQTLREFWASHPHLTEDVGWMSEELDAVIAEAQARGRTTAARHLRAVARTWDEAGEPDTFRDCLRGLARQIQELPNE